MLIMTNLIAKVGVGTAKNFVKALERDAKYGVKQFKELGRGNEKLVKSSYDMAVHSNPARTALYRANSMLRKGVKMENIELPVDTFLGQLPTKQRKAVASLLGNPDKVVCSAKANAKGSGFSILGFIGKKGNKTVGKGAVSVSQLGTPNAVAKWKFGGKKLKTNGFVDCAQTVTPEQVSIIPSFMKRMLGIEVNAGNAARANISANAKNVIDILPEVQSGNSAIAKLVNNARNILS